MIINNQIQAPQPRGEEKSSFPCLLKATASQMAIMAAAAGAVGLLVVWPASWMVVGGLIKGASVSAPVLGAASGITKAIWGAGVAAGLFNNLRADQASKEFIQQADELLDLAKANNIDPSSVRVKVIGTFASKDANNPVVDVNLTELADLRNQLLAKENWMTSVKTNEGKTNSRTFFTVKMDEDSLNNLTSQITQGASLATPAISPDNFAAPAEPEKRSSLKM